MVKKCCLSIVFESSKRVAESIDFWKLQFLFLFFSRHMVIDGFYDFKVWSYRLTWALHRGLLVFNTDMVSRVRSTRCVDYFSSARSTKQVSHVSSCFITHNATGWVSNIVL